MYKFYFNNQLIILSEKLTIAQKSEKALVIHYNNLQQIEILKKQCNTEIFSFPIYILNHDLDFLFQQIFKAFYPIEAAGGLVFNEKNEILLIKRNDLWDLPKGKLEKNETIAEGALREVMEETNIENLSIEKEVKLPNLNQNRTFHTYEHKGKSVLKTTFWYIMKSTESQNLIPQAEEGITEVIWTDLDNAKLLLKDSYLSLQDLLCNFNAKTFFKIKPNSALFLDRDGVINQLLPGLYVKYWETDWKYESKALEAIVALSKLFKYVFVVTNQQGIGKKLMTTEDLNILHQNLLNDVENLGGKINKIYFAPQLNSWNHKMRKPNIGMGLQAKIDFPDFEFEDSFIVGDFKTDMEFGKRLNMKRVYVGNEDKAAVYDFKLENLNEFLKKINTI